MKWITNSLTVLVVLALLAHKVASPQQSLAVEILSDILILVFLLGLGEQVITYACVFLANRVSKPLSLTKTKNE